MPELDRNDLEVILALYLGGSGVAAARILGVDTSTVSPCLSPVEAAMTTVLINRGSREFHFTAESKSAASAAETMEEAMGEASLAVRSSRAD